MHIEPAYYFEENGVPVFRPTYDEFKDFNTFMNAVEPYGRVAGIIKVVPPKEWRELVPDITPGLRKVQIKKAITQEIKGGGLPPGTYRQVNMETRRVYSVQGWFDLAESSQHRSPTFDNEGRANNIPSQAIKRKRNRTQAHQVANSVTQHESECTTVVEAKMDVDYDDSVDRTTLTMTSLGSQDEKLEAGTADSDTIKDEDDHLNDDQQEMGDVTVNDEGETKIVRKRKRGLNAEGEDVNFDVRKVSSGYSLEYCKELERFYWRNITYVAPIYGADLLGSLFGDQFKNSWNLNKLDNVLNRLETDLPGVNKPYLYFGMWKASFAWHVEDMDLYSINYIHFGAPKQWYVVPTASRGRFEQYARSIFSDEKKKCPEFLRHKTCVISPNALASQSIPVNRLIQYAGEFVITFPFGMESALSIIMPANRTKIGYHSGFNLGFNCAESVNFALENWIELGRNAQYCRCVKDSVMLDVAALFDCRPITPPPERRKAPKTIHRCILCPSQDQEDLLQTNRPGEWAHRLCALYVPETTVIYDAEKDADVVCNIENIPKDRWALKCVFCKPLYKRRARDLGACIQCYKGKCVKAYHVTCAEKNDILLTQDYQCFCPPHDGRPKAPKGIVREIPNQSASEWQGGKDDAYVYY
ncbi:Lysine-specific demethylase 4B [Dinochytrium kinnereticum]|nr:Lysine-specific demethylase 4B [Dinochytrium kinnereticum]